MELKLTTDRHPPMIADALPTALFKDGLSLKIKEKIMFICT